MAARLIKAGSVDSERALIRTIGERRGPDRTRAVTAGGQLDFRFTTLSLLDMMVSVGGGVTFQPGQAARRAAMVSFKVLR